MRGIRLFVLLKEVTAFIILLLDESGTPCIGPSNRISRQELDQQRCFISYIYTSIQSSKQIFFWTAQIADLQILGLISLLQISKYIRCASPKIVYLLRLIRKLQIHTFLGYTRQPRPANFNDTSWQHCKKRKHFIWYSHKINLSPNCLKSPLFRTNAIKTILTVVGKMMTLDLWPIPLGGGAWGAGTNMWHPETPASYESLSAPLATQIPTLWILTSGGRGRARWGTLILDRCRAFDLFVSVDTHLCILGL